MINDIHLQNFRSYSDESFEFGPDVNIIVGANASGKTNLLESLLVICLGASYRAKDVELISYNTGYSRLQAHTGSNDTRTAYIEKLDNASKKTFKINDKSITRLSISNKLPIVIFEPNHLQMLHGSPDLRRQYIDDLLDQTTLGFSNILKQYRRALAQRNNLLKKGRKPVDNSLFVWNVRLSELGEKIATLRHSLLMKISPEINELYKSLAGAGSKIELEYHTGPRLDSYATDMLHRLETNMERDLELGFTTIGPHREDMLVCINKHPAQVTASRGETRTLLLAFKIIEANMLEASRNIKPILLLDDVFSELDGKRRKALTQYLQSRQSFITTTDADILLHHFTDGCTVIPIQPT